ncbi:MAG TPA: NAD-dependent epimerase/dehydratase family protein [Gemmatimonadales bacterium]|nr:NAD-dependent epimerase/dehydratase family protein [Gemmatimonadales bacterium]
MTPLVVVTGAAGFIGSHACAVLLRAGWRVVGLDNFDPCYPRWLKELALRPLLASPAFQFVEADVRDPTAVAGCLEGATAVVHLAARAGVRESVGRAAAYRDLNVGGTRTVLDACARAGVRRLVYASSSSVYGATTPPFTEHAGLPPAASPYAASKREGEELCREFAAARGLRAAILRFFSVYGPGQRPDQVLHRFARRATQGGSLPLFGDGSSERDYTYVGDAAEAVEAAVRWTGAVAAGAEPFNIGSGRATRLSQLVSLLAKALGTQPAVAPGRVHPADAPRTRADISRARRILGWTPTVSLEVGIPEFVRWYEVVYGREPVAVT